jgi:hypothetical protein
MAENGIFFVKSPFLELQTAHIYTIMAFIVPFLSVSHNVL